MEKYKKGGYIAVMTNQPDVHASWMVNSGLTSEDIEPSEYSAKVKSVIGDGESYLIYIPSIGFRCVVDVSEVLRRVSDDELTDDERNCEDSEEFTAPNVFVCQENYQELSNEDRCKHLAVAAMKELFPKDKIVSVELCHSDYLKSDLRAMIDRLIRERCSNNNQFQNKRDYFNEMLEHLRFKEYYNVRIGIKDKLDEGAINYVYAAVDNKIEEVSVLWDLYADTQRFVRSLGPEYDSVKNYFHDLRSEILSLE